MIRILINFAVFLILCGIGYALASEEVPEGLTSEILERTTASDSKWVGAGIKAFYVFSGLTILAIVLTEVRAIIKK